MWSASLVIIAALCSALSVASLIVELGVPVISSIINGRATSNPKSAGWQRLLTIKRRSCANGLHPPDDALCRLFQCPSVSPPQTCSPGPRRRAAARSTLRGNRPVRQVILRLIAELSIQARRRLHCCPGTVRPRGCGRAARDPRQAAKADAASRAADDRRRYCGRPVECGPGLDFHVAAASA